VSLRKLGIAALSLAAIGFAAAPAVDPQVYLEDIKFLASPEMRGRLTGSPELERAAHFIAAHFREFGLKPVNGGSFYQSFPFTTSGKLGAHNRLQFTEQGRTLRVAAGDFVPLQFSSSAKVAGPVVFAGYGITAPAYHYDDYAGIDVKGKLVLVLRHEPQEFDEHSIFAGKNFTMH